METAQGFGMLPLIRKGLCGYTKMKPRPESYFFINRNEITELKISTLAKVVKATFQLNDGLKVPLLISKKEKHLPYQEENVAIFYRNNR